MERSGQERIGREEGYGLFSLKLYTSSIGVSAYPRKSDKSLSVCLFICPVTSLADLLIYLVFFTEASTNSDKFISAQSKDSTAAIFCV